MISRILVSLLIVLALAACVSTSWYGQAISGHYRLMSARQDIDQLLDSGELESTMADRLEQAVDMIAFAESDLRLEAGGSYRQLVLTGQDAVSWNVVAAPEFSLEARRWCFPVSGCVAYRGYFDADDARRYADRLASSGYDVTVSPAIAYSTLGWFDDPLLDTMFRYDDAQLAAYIFHELAHQKLYVRGDTAFSEAYASFVEEAGVTAWLKDGGQIALIDSWRDREAASRDFNDLLRQVGRDLDRIYSSDVEDGRKRQQKAERFEALEKEYQELVEQRWGGRNFYWAWFDRGANNAQLALTESYQGGVCAFRQLFEQAGGDWGRFHELAASRAELGRNARREWLQQPCGDIASAGDL